MKLRSVTSAVVGIGLLMSTAARAQRPGSDELVLPKGDGQSGLCAPFDCSTRIQQVFDAATFPSAIRIDAIELFNTARQSAESFVEPARYQIFLSTTDVSSETVTADLDQNATRSQRLVAEFTITDFTTFFSGAFSVPLTRPFVYQPNQGNLLLEIRKDQTANFGDGTIYVDGNLQAPGVALVTDQLGVQRSTGMSVGFVGQFLGPADR
jgi:hypothetical protein